jgi:hypothetical protein
MPEFKEKIRIDDVTILRTTDMAVLCEIDGSEYWIPQAKSTMIRKSGKRAMRECSLFLSGLLIKRDLDRK